MSDRRRRDDDDEDLLSYLAGFVGFLLFLGLIFVMKHGPVEAARILGESVSAFRTASGL